MASEFGATYLPGGLPVGETLVGVGPVADRPDANSDLTPRFWFDSSTGLLYVDDSGTWYTLIPGTSSANTYTGNVIQRIVSTAQGTSGGYWAIRISGEILDRAFLYSFGVGLGGGSSSVDAVMRRTQAEEIGFYNASVLGDLIPILAGEPTSDSHVATKNYVDDNAGGTVDVVSNVATSTILGRTTAGTGDSEELTPSATRTLLDVPSNAEAILDSLIDAAGDLVYGTAADTPARLARGTQGQVLRATDSTVAWADSLALGVAGAGGKASTYYEPPFANFSTGALTTGVLCYMPLIVAKTGTIDRIAIWHTTNGSAGAVTRLGVYADSGNGQPGALLVDGGTVATDSGASAAKTVTVSVAVTPGIYWLAAVGQVATSGVHRQASILAWFPMGTTGAIANTSQDNLYYESGVTGALPATATPISLVSSTPRVAVRFT